MTALVRKKRETFRETVSARRETSNQGVRGGRAKGGGGSGKRGCKPRTIRKDGNDTARTRSDAMRGKKDSTRRKERLFQDKTQKKKRPAAWKGPKDRITTGM